jgi:DNA-binding winged helix-turn-helix (wHTH) protein
MDVNPHTSSLPIEITFAGWLIAPHANLLSYDSTPVDIEPLLFDLLLYFTLRQGTIVTRQQLIDEVWQQKFVDDNAINRAMSTLRRILKRVPDAPTFIKTHYKKGYSFVPDVNIIYAKEETPLQQDTSDSSEPSARGIEPSARVEPLAPAIEPSAPEIAPSAASETSIVTENASSANESAPKIQDKTFSKAQIAQDKSSDNQRFMPFSIASAIIVALAILIFIFSTASSTKKGNQDTNEALTSAEIIDAVASRTNMLSDRGVVFSPKINGEKSALAYSFIPENAQRLGLYAKDLKPYVLMRLIGATATYSQ